MISSYSSNIDAAVQNITLMNDTMTRVMEMISNMASILQNQPRDVDFDAATVNQVAAQGLDFIADMANLEVNGRYLFAGTDSLTRPVADLNLLKANGLAELNAWMAGSSTTTTYINNVAAFTGTGLGLSATVSTAQNISVRVSNETEISYGAIADRSGFQEALRAFGVLANLRAPDPALDTPSDADFDTVVDNLLTVLRDAGTALQGTLAGMSGSLFLAKGIQEAHTQDLALYAKQIDKAENADTAEAIAMLQALQTQLTASYQMTSILSQLSLTNFL
jgi:flagellar hook-associated protein 3 FlgL